MDSSDYMKINLKDWKVGSQKNSLSYFSRKKTARINKGLINKLKKISAEKDNVTTRFCLHDTPEETLHDMIIFQHQNKTCRKPHKHLDKDDTIHIIEGRLVTFIFDDFGGIKDKIILDPDNNFIYRMRRNQYHLSLPITDYVIYRETKQGPFKHDNIFAKWNYAKILKKNVDFMDLTCYNSYCKNPCSLNISKIIK